MQTKGIFDDLDNLIAGFLGYSTRAIAQAKEANEKRIEQLEGKIEQLDTVLHRQDQGRS